MADLPPNSSATRLTVAAATSATRLPARVEPVNETMSTSGWAAMASPTTGPKPDTRLNTPAGRPDLLEDVGQDEGVERSHLAGLEHHGATGGQGRRHLGGDLVERIVPRGDGTHHADRLTHDEGVAHRLLPGEVGGYLRHGTECGHG